MNVPIDMELMKTISVFHVGKLKLIYINTFLGIIEVISGDCISEVECIAREEKILGKFCYEICPVGTYKNSETTCAGCYPYCGYYLHLMEIPVYFTNAPENAEQNQIMFPFEEGILANLTYPIADSLFYFAIIMLFMQSLDNDKIFRLNISFSRFTISLPCNKQYRRR